MGSLIAIVVFVIVMLLFLAFAWSLGSLFSRALLCLTAPAPDTEAREIRALLCETERLQREAQPANTRLPLP